MDEQLTTAPATIHEIAVESTLENVLRLDCRTTYNGDYKAVEILLDLDTAIKEADLTDRQLEVLRLYYVSGFEHKEIGDKLGIHRSTVSHYVRNAIKKIAKVFADWDELEEEYNV